MREMPPPFSLTLGGDKGVCLVDADTQGPTAILHTGELVAQIESRMVGQRGRGNIRFRVVGDNSLGWAEAASQWGGCVDCIVHFRLNNHLFNSTLRLPSSISLTSVRQSPLVEPSDWDGVMLSTIRSEREALGVGELFHLWQPLIAILSFPPRLPRKEKTRWLQNATGSHLHPPREPIYSLTWIDRDHTYFGGVTVARLSFAHYTRVTGGISRSLIMTARQFRRPLQTALDDTLGPPRNVVFEKLEPNNEMVRVVGSVTTKRGQSTLVYGADGLAPDLGALPADKRHIWVQADSVFSPPRGGHRPKCVRRINNAELLAAWDYEGKFEARNWEEELEKAITTARLSSPPAKMIRSFVFSAGTFILDHSGLTEEIPALLPPGKTSDVPFSPLEESANIRLKAAQADDAEVDLSQWALPGKTNEQAQAQKILRRFAVKWWKYYQIKAARAWLKRNPGKPNERAINDCIRRIKGCTYWAWPWGSRIFFWKFDGTDWLVDFRDGVRFWRTGPQPKGAAPDVVAPSREAELVTRGKIFQLWYSYFLSDKNAVLVIPRFIVPKVIADDGTILDVRCVWDCRRNGHNEVLYAPGFMLPTGSDAEDQVVKWLLTTVSDYLQRSRQVEDYTQDNKHFVKSKQGDIDVGKHFNNFRAHPDDQ